jgi:exopolysaccharide biosynthesis polyprenyl glycosylphosphotransferase
MREMPIDLLVHTEDPTAERREADRRAADRRAAPREGAERRGTERRRRWSSAPRAVKAPTAIPEGQPLPRVASRERRYRRALVAADAIAASLALLLSWLLAGLALSPVHLLVPLAAVLALEAGDLYDRDDLVLRRSTLDEAPSLLQFAALATIAAALIGGQALEPIVLVALWLILGFSLVLVRAAARAVVRRTVECERCLVIGDAELATHLRGKVHASRARAEVIATLPLGPGETPDAFHGHLGLLALVLEHDVDRVILAPTAADNRQTLELIRVAKAVGVRVSLLPRMFEVVGSSVDFEDVDGVTMLGLRRFGLSTSARSVKRAFDVVVSSLALVALAPVAAAIALAVRLDSPGPILFRQLRVGRGGSRFRMLKFRTMVQDAEQRKAALADRNETQGFFKITDDPRITRVGRLLRKTSLDEIPQFLNVLRGEMSIVGPRPLIVDEDERIVGLDRSRLHLTPGMTGPWQVLGSSRIPLSEMVSLDYVYVTNWSLWLDIKLLLRTLPHVIARRGR